MSGRNPYAANLTHSNSNASGRYGDLYAQDKSSSTSSINGHLPRERRPGGYGGLGADPNEESPQPAISRPRYGVEEDAGYGRRSARDNRDREYRDSSRSRDRAVPKTNGISATAGHSSQRRQRSMEGESAGDTGLISC
jgi:hypothetical protein